MGKTHGSAFVVQLIPIGVKVIFKPAETKQDSAANMEPTSMTGVFAGYKMAPGCRWAGIYTFWTFEDCAEIDLSTKSLILSRRSRRPHKTKVVERLDEGICFPLKSEYDRVNYTLKCLRQSTPPTALELLSADGLEDATVRVLPAGARWGRLGRHWMRIHSVPRNSAYIPQLEEDGPDLSTLLGIRITFKAYDRGHVDTSTDDWQSAATDEERYPWTGTILSLSIRHLIRNRILGPKKEFRNMHDDDWLICHRCDLGTAMVRRCPFMKISPCLLDEKMGSGVAKTYEADFTL